MKSVFLIALAGLATANVLNPRADCTADNCLRALTGTGSNDKTTRPVLAKSDCSSYLYTIVTTTVTPSTSTITSTVSETDTTSTTSTTTSPTTTTTSTTFVSVEITSTTTTVTSVAPRFGKRDLVIPTYASACSGSVRYSSACSCFGVLPTTTTVTSTLATPTTITTITATSISTITTVTTDFTTETDVSVTSTTTTTTAIATSTYTITQCTNVLLNPTYTLRYILSALGGVNTITGTTVETCCIACYELDGCYAFRWPGLGVCNLLYTGTNFASLYSSSIVGAPTDMCPVGTVNLPVTAGGTDVVRGGPCLAT